MGSTSRTVGAPQQRARLAGALRRLVSIAPPAALGCLLALPAVTAADEDAPAHHHDEHAVHHHPAPAAQTKRAVVHYRIPAVPLVRADRARVMFPDEIDDGRPTVLTFIYTTCTAVCPMISQTLAAFQTRLGADAQKMHVVSISVDPEHDTPARLADYQQRYHAGPQWNHYTGALDDSLKLQRAFDAYFGDKMSHRPILFMRAAPDKPWVRLEGFLSPDDLVREYRALTTAG